MIGFPLDIPKPAVLLDKNTQNRYFNAYFWKLHHRRHQTTGGTTTDNKKGDKTGDKDKKGDKADTMTNKKGDKGRQAGRKAHMLSRSKADTLRSTRLLETEGGTQRYIYIIRDTKIEEMFRIFQIEGAIFGGFQARL